MEIDSIKAELEALKPQQQTTSTPVHPEHETGIADDDPELAKYLSEWDNPLLTEFPALAKLCPKPPVPEAKKAIARKRTIALLTQTIGDESLPMPERIEAAKQMKARGLWPPYIFAGMITERLSPADIVERLSPHPHVERLKELKRSTRDEAATVKDRFAAMYEYEQLKEQFPERYIGDAYVLVFDGWGLAPARALASEVAGKVADKTGGSETVIAEKVLNSAGVEYDVPLSEA